MPLSCKWSSTVCFTNAHILTHSLSLKCLIFLCALTLGWPCTLRTSHTFTGSWALTPLCVYCILMISYSHRTDMQPIQLFCTHDLVQISTFLAFQHTPMLSDIHTAVQNHILPIHELGHSYRVHPEMTITCIQPHILTDTCLLTQLRTLRTPNDLAPSLNFTFPCTLKTSNAHITLQYIPVYHADMI